MKKFLISIFTVFLFCSFYSINAQADQQKNCNDCFEISTYDDDLLICDSRKEYIKYIHNCKKITGEAFKPPQNGEFPNWESVYIRVALEDCGGEAKEIFCKKKNRKGD